MEAVLAERPTATVKPQKWAAPRVARKVSFFAICQAAGAQAQAALSEAFTLDRDEYERFDVGNTFRLIRAANLALTALEYEDNTWTEGELMEALFDACALIDCAYECRGDRISSERIACLDRARAALAAALETFGSGLHARLCRLTLRPGEIL